MRTLLLIYAMRLRAVRNAMFRRGWRHGLGWVLVFLAVAVVDVTVYHVAPQTL